jgi:hypothetical protein
LTSLIRLKNSIGPSGPVLAPGVVPALPISTTCPPYGMSFGFVTVTGLSASRDAVTRNPRPRIAIVRNAQNTTSIVPLMN